VAGRGQGGWGRREVEGRPDRWAPPVSRRERRRREVGRRVWLGREGRMGREKKKKREWAGWGRGLGFVFFQILLNNFSNLFLNQTLLHLFTFFYKLF
jgi:hypothetical protein